MLRVRARLLGKSAQKVLAGTVLAVLGRGIVSSAAYDPSVAAEVLSWPDPTVIRIEVASGPAVVVQRSGRTVRAVRTAAAPTPTLTVRFKSVEGALPALIGAQPILGTFSQHRATVAGDLALAMSLVRVLHTVEGYLFPDIINRRVLPAPATRVRGHIRAYLALVAGGRRQLPQQSQES